MTLRSSMLAAALAVSTLAPLWAGPADAQATGGPSISDVRVRATPPGASVGAAYLKVEAGAAGTDKLIGAKVDGSVAAMAQIHDMFEEGGIMKMRHIEAIEVKPGTPAELKPGGKHVMIMDLKHPLAAGDTIKLTLVFEKAGEVTVDAKVVQIGAVSGASAKPMTGQMDHMNAAH